MGDPSSDSLACERLNVPVIAQQNLQSWWAGLTSEQRGRAVIVASRPAPRGMLIDDLTASMIQAALPTSRQIWTGQPEHLVEMLDDVAEFVLGVGRVP